MIAYGRPKEKYPGQKLGQAILNYIGKNKLTLDWSFQEPHFEKK